MPKRGRLSAALIAAVVLVTVFAPLFMPYDPNGIDLDSLREPPGARHLFGTDQKGRDVFTRVVYGGRISLGVAVLAAFVSMFIGLGVGIVSGYYGGKLDAALMAFVDLILSFPSLLLAIGVSVILPPGIYTVMIAIAAVGWAAFARLIRGQVLTIKDALYIHSARASGAGDMRILLTHVLPQCVSLSLVMMGLKLGGYIITEASLSFLGLGAQPPTASWGSMVSASRAYIAVSPWMVIFPGAAIALTALCFNVLGDALSEKYGIKSSLKG